MALHPISRILRSDGRADAHDRERLGSARAGRLEAGALAPYRTRDGRYRVENTFVYVVAGG
jgi:hypothetical protein